MYSMSGVTLKYFFFVFFYLDGESEGVEYFESALGILPSLLLKYVNTKKKMLKNYLV